MPTARGPPCRRCHGERWWPPRRRKRRGLPPGSATGPTRFASGGPGRPHGWRRPDVVVGNRHRLDPAPPGIAARHARAGTASAARRHGEFRGPGRSFDPFLFLSPTRGLPSAPGGDVERPASGHDIDLPVAVDAPGAPVREEGDVAGRWGVSSAGGNAPGDGRPPGPPGGGSGSLVHLRRWGTVGAAGAGPWRALSTGTAVAGPGRRPAVPRRGPRGWSGPGGGGPGGRLARPWTTTQISHRSGARVRATP